MPIKKKVRFTLTFLQIIMRYNNNIQDKNLDSFNDNWFEHISLILIAR